jgi:hypothetical protein
MKCKMFSSGVMAKFGPGTDSDPEPYQGVAGSGSATLVIYRNKKSVLRSFVILRCHLTKPCY